MLFCLFALFFGAKYLVRHTRRLCKAIVLPPCGNRCHKGKYYTYRLINIVLGERDCTLAEYCEELINERKAQTESTCDCSG